MSCPQNTCGCICTKRNRPVTLKGIDKTNGVTEWEYGPGAFWRHHYGADAISGVVPNLSATLDTYAMPAGAYPAFNNTHNRNTSSIIPNAVEALTVTKLNSLDGTVIESAILDGFFCGDITETSFSLSPGLTIRNAAALSGGDYVIVGERLPFIEFVDYSSNTATKEYILHPHGMIGGNVYLKTRTSSETITIPYNSTAGEVETLFEATTDCTAATATGGPWPLKPITIEAVWSVSSGDISGIAVTGTQSATGGGADWSYSTGEYDVGIDFLMLNVSTVSIGTTFKFSLALGLDFEYESTTDDVSTFLAALEGAMEAFALAQGADGAWESIASGIPDSVVVAGSSITIYYSNELGIDPLTVELTAGGTPTTDTRNVKSAAASYDTDTGEMMSSVGYQFGYSAGSPPPFIFSEAASAPSVTGLNVLGIDCIGAGPSNSVVVTPRSRGTGDNQKASVVEAWTIASGAWSQDWVKYCNATLAMPQIIMCESGYVLCPINAKRFDSARDRTGARLLVSDGTVDEINRNFSSVNSPNNNVLTQLYDDDSASTFSYAYSGRYTDPNRPNNTYRNNRDGSDTDADGTFLKLGATAFGADGSSVFGLANGATETFAYVPSTALAHLFYISFLPQADVRSAEPQQFRFTFANGQSTSWLDWYATESEIKTAMLTLLGENSNPPGFGSNVEFVSFTISVDNNPVSAIERGIQIQFQTDYGYSPGSTFIPVAFFSTSPGVVRIEVQTVTPFSTPGIAAYDITNADVVWSRAWGTKGTTTIAQPEYAWLQGDYVYAYGAIVDNEL